MHACMPDACACMQLLRVSGPSFPDTLVSLSDVFPAACGDPDKAHSPAVVLRYTNVSICMAHALLTHTQTLNTCHALLVHIYVP